MAEVPMSNADLEAIVEEISFALYEKWAVDGRFDEPEAETYSQLAVEDAVFCISSFMDKFNELMNQKAREVLNIK